MTVPAQDRFTFSSGNGVTTTFPYTFMIPGTVDDPQFLVYLIEIATGTRTDLTVDVDYSISGLGVEEGGVVTYPLSGAPLAATHRLVIESNMPYEQQTDVYNSGTLYLSAIEDQFDNTTRQVQQIQDRVNRTFSVGIGYEGNYELFPVADMLIGWNEDGTGLENKLADSERAAAAYAAQLAAEAAQVSAQTAQDFAHKWATEAENVQVDDGVNAPGFSAYHWAQVATDIVGNALQPDDIGTEIGQLVAREDYQGERAIYTDGGQTVFARRTVGLSDAVDWQFLRVQNVAGPDTTFGWVNANLVAATDVNATSDRSEWAFLAKLTVNAPSTWPQHVAAYGQAVKLADANTWAFCSEMRDLVANPTKGSIGYEAGMFVGGMDGNNQRVALHIPMDRHISQSGTAHEVSRGLWITADSGNISVKWGAEIKGKFGVGLDLTGLDVAFSDKAIELAQNQFIRWRDGYHSATEKGAIGWVSTIDTWLMSGVKLTTAAVTGGTAAAPPANPNSYVNIQINGVMLKIPAYS